MKKPQSSKRSSKTRVVDAAAPDSGIINEALRVLKGGGMVVFPTRCLYGIAADAANIRAVEHLYRVKHRLADKPIPILVDGYGMLSRVAQDVPPHTRQLLKTVWPGRLTVVLWAHPRVPDILTAGTGNIGVRMPGHPVARALVQRFGRPITATSANISDQAGCNDLRQLNPVLYSGVDMVLDAGPLEGGVGSTVLDLTVTPYRILREGAVSRAELSRILGPGGLA
ncbi:MAG: L-threonylcarbamoyladenylate synthase [Pseudomonadota bacterium]